MTNHRVLTDGPIGFGLRRMVDRHPLHAALVDRWRIIPSDAVPTAGVRLASDLRVELSYNQAFIEGLTPDELSNVLLHECHHVLFSHLTMTADQYPNQDALTIAQEVTVNEFIPGPLPGSPVLLEQFPELPRSESTAARYRRLCRQSRNHGLKLWCGLATRSSLGPEAWRSMLIADVGAAIQGLPTELQTRAIGELARMGMIGTGNSSGPGLIPLPAGSLPRSNWQSIVRRFALSIAAPVVSRARPSRRFPHLLGVVPGRIRTPMKPRIMVAIDTSGSMIQPAILATIRGEVEVLSAFAELLVVECDTKVRREYLYEHDLADVVGGGGTSFCAPLSEQFIRSRRVDGVIYFTDGYGKAPAQAPAVPVLWCLIGSGTRPANWGHVIRLSAD